MQEQTAMAIEMNSRWRRIVRIACGETGLTAFLLNAGRSGLSFEQIEAVMALNIISLRLLLMLACAFKLVKRNPNSLRYHATKRLRLEAPQLLYQLFDASPAFLGDSVRTGSNSGLRVLPGAGATLYERLANYPDLEGHYIASLASMNKNERIPLVLEGIRQLRGHVGHVLDLGGNTGVTAAEIASHYPDLQVTVFDLPSVCAKGRAQCISKTVTFVEGNLAVDSLPTGVDCVVLSAVLEVMPVAQAHRLMRRIYEALPRGGSVIVVQWMTNELETGPVPAALAAWYFFNVCAPSPMPLCINDMRTLAKECGFASFEVHQLNRNPLVAMIIRK